MAKIISPEQQRLILEKLYRSDDALSSTEKFNKQHGATLGQLGERSMEASEFARIMKTAGHKSLEVEKHTKDISGHEIDLESL